MKTIATIAAIFGTFFTCSAQSLNDVIEGSHRSKSEKIYISSESKFIFFGDQIKVLDSSMLIQTPDHYEVYLQAYNPLLKSHTFESKVIDDELQVALDKALADISSNLTNFFDQTTEGTKELPSSSISESYKIGEIIEDLTVAETNKCDCGCDLFNEKYSSFSRKEETLKTYIDSLAKKQFVTRLAHLKFKNADNTEQNFDVIEKDFEDFKKSVMDKKDIEELMGEKDKACDETYTYLLKDYQAKLFNELKALEGKLDGIEKVIAKVSSYIAKWSVNGKIAERDNFWYFKLTSGDHTRGKSQSLSFALTEHSELKNGTVVKKEKETISKYEFHLRKYRFLLPEISTGVIYTSIVTPSFVLGEGNVLERANDHSLERFKFSQMINANFNIKGGSVLPFVQAGVALNNDIPIGIVGAGLRLRTSPKNGIAISFGCAMTGVKKLNTLNEGQVVSDDATLQNDLKYDFLAKPYFGIQFNF